MSSPHLPGKLTLFAPAVSCLAQDGVVGGHSPFVGALLSWFGDATLVKCNVLDPAVRGRVDHMVQTASKFQQQPEWNHSGKIVFRFSEEQQTYEEVFSFEEQQGHERIHTHLKRAHSRTCVTHSLSHTKSKTDSLLITHTCT